MNTIKFIYLKINSLLNYLFDILTMGTIPIYERVNNDDDDEEIIYINEHMIIDR